MRPWWNAKFQVLWLILFMLKHGLLIMVTSLPPLLPLIMVLSCENLHNSTFSSIHPCFSSHFILRQIFFVWLQLLYYIIVVVAQSYEVEADNEYVIRGNSAVMKCEIPSFVSDFVIVESWQDSQGNTYLPGEDYGNSNKSYSLSITQDQNSNTSLIYLFP